MKTTRAERDALRRLYADGCMSADKDKAIPLLAHALSALPGLLNDADAAEEYERALREIEEHQRNSGRCTCGGCGIARAAFARASGGRR